MVNGEIRGRLNPEVISKIVKQVQEVETPTKAE